jgi:hypothetical protein
VTGRREKYCARAKSGPHCRDVKRVIVKTRLAADELAVLDALAHDRGLTRSATIRLLIGRGLQQVGPPGSLTPYPPTDEGGWPASPEVRLELVRRRLWDLSSAGSATATVALERALARERVTTPSRESVTVDDDDPFRDDPFREVDELAEMRRRGAT